MEASPVSSPPVTNQFSSSRNLISAGLFFLVAALASSTQSFASSTDDYRRAPTRDWPMVGGDLSNTRYSALTQINTGNVGQLGAAWTSKNFDEGGTSRATPVVKNGLMFITAGRHVYALNAETGEVRWTYNTLPEIPTQSLTASAAKALEQANSPKGIPNGKGVGLGAGLVFVGLKDGHIIALKQQTGELIWARQTGIDHPKKGQWAAVAPTYSNGVVFSGLSDGDHNQRGRLTAIDAQTGRLLWRMFSVPGPGEPGHETWPSSNDAWMFGGGGVWTNPPVDPDLGIAYFTAGNAVPAYAGDWRPGDNLYTCSVLAIDIKTGKLKWHYQLVHHDVFEADLGVPIVLYDTSIAGKARKALAVMRADGHLFQLDRETGQPLLPVEERPVPQLASQKTSPTQPFPVNGESILMSCEDWKKEGIPAGFALGCMFTPAAWPPPSTDPQNVLVPFPLAKGSLMAYNPQTGYIYAQGYSALHWPRRSQDPYFLNWVGAVPGLKSYGELAAIDTLTGKIAWRKRMPATSLGGGPLTTGGGLMFRSARDGDVSGHDARTGDVLWTFHTGMGGAGPAASYEIDSTQYIALSTGPAVMAFKLGGGVSSAPAPTSSPHEDFSGPLIDTDEIETTSLHRSLIEPGARYFLDEFTFNPYRARVKVGTKLLFVNNGVMRHRIEAVDGSWSTGPLSATQEFWMTFEKPGQYIYICKDHPWSYGQIVVVAPDAPPQGTVTSKESDSSKPDSFVEQVLRGQAQFKRNCSACHGEDLNGRASVPALLGKTFVMRWSNAQVADLFDNIRTTMPQGSPGALDRHTYLDIVAFLLHANNLSSSENAIDDDSESLRTMKISQDK